MNNYARTLALAALIITNLLWAGCQSANSPEQSKVAVEARNIQTSQNGNKNAPAKTANDPASNASANQQSSSQQIAKDESGNNQKRCQPASVPRTPGLSPQFDVDELMPEPTDAAEMNELLYKVVGDFQVETGYDVLSFDGDYNGDGCRDIAVVVRYSDRFHNVKSLADAVGDTSVDVTITNLRVGTTLSPVDSGKRGAGLPSALKPRQPLALVILHGGAGGKVWAHGGVGRVFLLLDSVYEPYGKSGLENQLQLLWKKGHNGKAPDAEIPSESKGDGLLVGRNSKYVNKQSYYTDRMIIYFDGANYTARKLPDITTSDNQN